MDSHGRPPPCKGKRWVCPNDRQLALRAKLRTGWSVKSESFESRYADFSYSSSCPGNLNSSPSTSTTPFALTDEERTTIVQVIQRAEALDVSEQERVGRLVERLENMKRNVRTVTTARSSTRSCGSRCTNGCVCSCALCGERFAVIGAGPSLCHDCRKYICQKCGIETSPSLVLASGSSASSSGSSSATSQAQSSIPSVTLHLRLKTSKDNGNRWFLCRICAETREMWKKSGAWFFKGLPKYVLPEKKERSRSRGGSRSLGWSTASGARSLEPAEQDSSSDDDAAHRMTRTRSLLSANCDAEAARGEGATTSVGAPHVGVRSNSSASVDRRLSNGAECSQSANNRRFSSTSSAAARSKSAVTTSAQRGRRSTIGDERKPDLLTANAASVSQVHHRSASSLSSGSRRASSTTAVSGTSSMASVSSMRDQQPSSHNSLDHLPRNGRKGSSEKAQGYGTLEIALHYDPEKQCLHCKILRARNLRGMDMQELSDPFCKVNILPLTKKSTPKFQKTKTVHRTRDPEFNEQLKFFGITESDMKSGRALHVRVLQDDRVGRDFLGEAKFPLYEVPRYQTKFYNVYLEEHYKVTQETKVWGEDHTNGRGQIQLTLSYSTRRRALLVTVERATNLIPMDNNGYSDPFVKLCLTKESSKITTSILQKISTFTQIIRSGERSAKKLIKRKKSNSRSTTVKWKTLNPEWNEEFAFETQLTDLSGLALLIWVWDKDLGKTNDYLGGLILSCNSKGARLRQWLNAMRFPDHRHHATHNLIQDFISHG